MRIEGAQGINQPAFPLAIALTAALVLLFSGCNSGASPYRKASRLAGRGRYAAAEAVAKKAVELEPGSADARLLLGRIYLARYLYPEAIDAFEAARRLDPSGALAPYNLGVVYEDLDDLDQAEALYRAAVALSPDFSPALFRLAGLCLRRGRLKEAGNLYERFLVLESDHPTARNNLGVVYFRLGDISAARNEFLRSLAFDAVLPQALFNLGVLSLAEEENSAGREYFERLIKVYPRSAPALEARELLARPQDSSPAERELAERSQHLRRGMELESLDRLEPALEEYLSALALDAADGRTHYRLGRLYERMGREIKAVDHYEKFLSLDRNLKSSLSPEVLDRLSNLRSRLGQSLLVRGELPPTPPPSPLPTPGAEEHWRRGRRHAERGDWPAALQEYEKALEIDESHAPSWLGKGTALREKGEYDAARAALERAFRLDPLLPAEKEVARLHFESGAAAATAGKHAAAIEMFLRARDSGLRKEAEEGLWNSYQALVKSLLVSGNPSAAASYLEESLKIKRDHAPTLLALGDVYSRNLDRPAAARVHYEAYLRLAPRSAEAERIRRYLSPPPPAVPAPTPAISAETFYNRAVAAQRKGRAAAAEEDYMKAISANKDFYQAYYNLGALYRETGRIEQARQAFQHTLDLHPDFSPAHLALFNIYQNNFKNTERSRYHARRFVELETGSEPAQILRRWLEQ